MPARIGRNSQANADATAVKYKRNAIASSVEVAMSGRVNMMISLLCKTIPTGAIVSRQVGKMVA